MLFAYKFGRYLNSLITNLLDVLSGEGLELFGGHCSLEQKTHRFWWMGLVMTVESQMGSM